MTFDKCAILGWPLKTGEAKPFTSSSFEYETEFVGRIKITIPAYNELLTGDYERYLIAGICKHRTLEQKDPVLIDSEFIRTGYKKLNPPLHFEEKVYQFLKYLYSSGGRENYEFEINSTKHFPLAYADQEEFIRIVDYLEDNYFISCGNKHRTNSGNFYTGVKLTGVGRAEAEKTLPKLPLYGLISQEITTGDFEIDEKINHARQLFFEEPITMDKMRSACEALSYVLEPLRKDLETFFKSKDVSDFFQIVNNFDIRHNKDHTKDLVHHEQLEWVFYSLLNTINTYTKMKGREV